MSSEGINLDSKAALVPAATQASVPESAPAPSWPSPPKEAEESWSPAADDKYRAGSKRRCRLIALLVFIGVVGIGITLYFAISDAVKETAAPAERVVLERKHLSDELRITCLPDFYGRAPLRLECLERRCRWDETPNVTTPCYADPDQALEGGRGHYIVTSVNDSVPYGKELSLSWTPKKAKSLFGEAFEQLVVEVHYYGVDKLRIKIADAEKKRYEVPVQLNLPASTKRIEAKRYDVVTAAKGERFWVAVKRTGTGATIFNTSVSDLLFEDQFITLSTVLPSKNIYGFGENIHPTFRHNTSFKSWPMWARDQPVSWQAGANLYGVHPFYMCIENDTSSHGVLLLNSNAMDYSFTPYPILTYRTIGGIMDFYFFLGPTPENVVQQYTGVIGRPYMPPYWGLGFHLCRYGYKNTQDVIEAVERTRKADIPLDAQYADIDYMEENKDFTLSRDFLELPAYFAQLRQNGTRTVIMLDPALAAVDSYQPYKEGKEKNAFIKWPTNKTCPDCADNAGNMLGFVWPLEKVVFPDFFNNETKVLWKNWIMRFYDELSFDGLWIDMNEPASFGTNEPGPIFNWPEGKDIWSLKCDMSNTLENPPYKTMAVYAHSKDAHISDKTICMTAVHTNGAQKYEHYNVHNLYGWSQTPVTLEALRQVHPKKRGMIITRSMYPGSGAYAGHWLGDNESTWKDLRDSIIGMLEFNLFGIPYVGADICGFFENTTAELCQRWMEVGAFYPYSRNHNQKEAFNQDPGTFEDLRVASASRNALKIRYQLLPYLYTLFHFAHTRGDTVARSMANEWPYDATALGVDQQFLWGPALLISPILYEGQKQLTYYLPHGVWYNYYYGHAQHAGAQSIEVNRDTRIQLHVRGGHILPIKVSGSKNTENSRKTPFSLIVALDEEGQAQGQLFWDDGESINTYENGAYYLFTFISKQGTLRLRREGSGFTNNDGADSMVLANVTIFGVKQKPQFVYLDTSRHYLYSYDHQSQKLVLLELGVRLDAINSSFFEQFRITWGDSDPHASEVRLIVDCLPHVAPEAQTKTMCDREECIWNPSIAIENNKAPRCSLDNTRHNYTVQSVNRGQTKTTVTLSKPEAKSYSFATPDPSPTLEIEEYSGSILHFKFSLSSGDQYEVPVHLSDTRNSTEERLYRVEYTNVTNNPFQFKVIRKSTNTIIFDTSIGGLFLSKQFQQIVTRLPSTNVYGFGENDHQTLKHSNDFETWPMFARDQPPGAGHSNLYGVHPFYVCIDDTNSGATHGVLLWNSNAMEYKLQPDPSLTLRTIGGLLDFYVFLGPTPDSVIQQYTTLIGRPLLPPYWSLGFQLCRYGYNSLNELQAAVTRTTEAGIPLDVQYADIDHMEEQKDFTFDLKNFNPVEMKQYVNDIKNQGIKFIIILDPALLVNDTYSPYANGKAADAYIKWPLEYSQDNFITGSQAMAGYVWPNGYAVFPDFFKPQAQTFWKSEIVKHRQQIGFDGLWIDMNEPANFGTEEDRPWNWPEDRLPWWSLKCPKDNLYDNPPYKPRSIFGNTLSDKTICMVADQTNGSTTFKHYDVHNLYGWSQSEPTQQAVQQATGKRGIVISRSTFPGSGRYVGHWLGDNAATWRHMKESIIGIIEFNLFGIPYIGADICGFFGDSDPELCQRWMQLGAFYTYSRNHNGLGNRPQDPAWFGPSVAASSKKALDTRYELLPYLYTLFKKANEKGTPVIKALWHEYPADPMTWDVDEQFLWGKDLLITPVLKPGKTSVEGYFPRDMWYNYYTGAVETSNGGIYSLLNAPRDTIPLHIRGGAIFPRQQSANNTHFSRSKPMNLLIALDGSGSARGSLYWDDGDSIDVKEYFKADFAFDRDDSAHKTWVLKAINVEKQLSTLILPPLESLVVYGLPYRPDKMDDQAIPASAIWDENTKALTLKVDKALDSLNSIKISAS